MTIESGGESNNKLNFDQKLERLNDRIADARAIFDGAEQGRLEAERDALVAQESTPGQGVEMGASPVDETQGTTVADISEEPLHDAHVKKFESAMEQRAKYLEQQVDRLISMFTARYGSVKDDVVLKIKSGTDRFTVVDTNYLQQIKLREERVRDRERGHVDTVIRSNSENRDVADRMRELQRKGASMMQIRDDLIHESTRTPEYKKLAQLAAYKLTDLANADFDNDPNRGKEVRYPSDNSAEFSLDLSSSKLNELIPLPKIPEEIKLGDLKALLTDYKEKYFGQDAPKKFIAAE